MYKVFVVDDEIVIREGLRNSFHWEENGFSLVGEAPDGEIALPMIRDEKPDILITDIRMPFMDGIALCREIRQVMPWMQIVILSGFDSFEYAKQAISLGVQEYLLKPFSADELKRVLERLSERIEKEHAERRNLEKLRQQMVTGKLLVQDTIISNAMLNNITEDEGEKNCAQLRSLGINLISPCYTVIEFHTKDSAKQYTDMHALLMQVLERCYETVFVCSGNAYLNALVLGDSEKDIEERAYSFARSVLDELDRAGFPDVRATIGDTVNNFYEINASYKSARHTRHVVENYGQPLHMRRITSSRDVQEPPKAENKSIEIQSLYDRMKYADLGDFKEQFMEYVDWLKEMFAYIHQDGNYLCSEVLLTACRIILETGGDPQKVLDQKWLDEGNISTNDLDSDVSNSLCILHQAIKFRDSKCNVKGNPVVNKARQYLESNFTNPNLTFQEVVDYVSMSSSHFSTLFSQTTGVTFTKYLIDLRMRKSRELLLNTSMRSSEIAYAVGFTDPHYFSYLFKKTTGVTPSEFRSTLSKSEVSQEKD